MSAPPENMRPSPASTMALMAGSAMAASSAAERCWRNASDRPLTGGLAHRIRATLPGRSKLPLLATPPPAGPRLLPPPTPPNNPSHPPPGLPFGSSRANLDQIAHHSASRLRLYGDFHLHGFDDQQRITGRHAVVGRRTVGGDAPRQGGTDSGHRELLV